MRTFRFHSMTWVLPSALVLSGCSGAPDSRLDDKQPVTAEQALHGIQAGTLSSWFLNEYDPRSDLYVARDFNPDPDIVEVILVAKETEKRLLPGVRTKVWTYNGVMPGPQIMGDVGDTVIAHVVNFLPVETTIHWHGVELKAAMDGSFVTQGPISSPGYFRYEFKMRTPALYWYHPHIRTDKQIEKGLQAPLIMRDPAENDLLNIDSSHERTFVLDDILLETDESDPNYGDFQDFALDDDYLDEHTPAERADLIFDGRETEESMLLVNGKGVVDPEANPDGLFTIHVEAGVAERWRFVNTSDGRMMRVSIDGQTLYQVGTDGGLLEQPIARPPIGQIPDPDDAGQTISNPDLSQGIALGVAERADVVFLPDAEPGDVLYMEWHDFPRGRHEVVSPGETLSNGTLCEGEAPCFGDQENDGKLAPKRMMKIVVDAPSEPAAPYELPETLRDIEDIRGDVDLSDLDQALPITFGHAPPNPQGLVTFFAAVQDPMGLLAAARAATGPVPPPAFGPRPLPAVLADPEGLALWAELGQTRYWEAVNFTGNEHPLHTHGFFFQPIHTRYVDLQNPDNNQVVDYPLQVKDTLLLPKRPGALGMSYTITRMAVRLSDEHLAPELRRTEDELVAFGADPSVRPGGWLDHCHIDQHAQAGMMTLLNTVAPGYPLP